MCAINSLAKASPLTARALRKLRLRHGGFLDKDRSNLFCRIEFAIPFFALGKIFSAFETFELSRLPRHGANGFFDFGNSETAPGQVARCVIGKPNRFHRMGLNSEANPNETKNERRSR